VTSVRPVEPDPHDSAAEGLVIDGVGTRMRLRCPEELRRPLRRLLQPMITSDDRPAGDHEQPLMSLLQEAGRHRLVEPDGRTIRLPEGREIAEVLRRLNAALIARSPYFCAHAAVLSVSDGALAILAASGSGKSTTTAAGLQQGLGYLSDEVLAVNWPGPDAGEAEPVAQPYPRPLGLSSWSCRALRIGTDAVLAEDPTEDEYFVPPAAITTRIHRAARPLRHIVVLGPPREDGRLVPLGRRDSVPALLQRAFNAWQDPASAFRLAHGIAAAADCWLLEPGPPQEVGRLLRERFGVDGEVSDGLPVDES
jgi:hypothetical protein